jgi:hypothetical protein
MTNNRKEYPNLMSQDAPMNEYFGAYRKFTSYGTIYVGSTGAELYRADVEADRREAPRAYDGIDVRMNRAA